MTQSGKHFGTTNRLMNNQPMQRNQTPGPARLMAWLGVTTLAAIGGCTVGPDYQQPKTDVPSSWINSPSAASQPKTTTQRPIDVTQWWRVYNDPELDSLVDRAASGNLDVKQAEARLRESRATRGVVGSSLLPNVNANGQYTRSGSGHGNNISIPVPGGGTISKSTAQQQRLLSGRV